MSQTNNARTEMNAMYRLTRHVYDASRKYYLLGRDRLIQNLNPSDNDHICEIGCGTARNLILMQNTWPNANFYGIDASDEMLKTAHKSLEKNKLSKKISLRQAFAQNFDPQEIFNQKHFNKIVFSYALSIIPPWKESINHALTLLSENGELHIVDFGAQENLPNWFRKALFWWLKLFHVHHKPEILEHLKTLETQGKGHLTTTHLYKGYTYLAIFTKTD